MTSKHINDLNSIINENIELFIQINVKDLCDLLLGKMQNIDKNNKK